MKNSRGMLQRRLRATATRDNERHTSGRNAKYALEIYYEPCETSYAIHNAHEVPIEQRYVNRRQDINARRKEREIARPNVRPESNVTLRYVNARYVSFPRGRLGKSRVGRRAEKKLERKKRRQIG